MPTHKLNGVDERELDGGPEATLIKKIFVADRKGPLRIEHCP